jgi:hypothetical protein
VYWFMRMRQGSKGPDFTKELWQERLVGVLWGTWKIADVLNGNNEVAEDALTPEKLGVSKKELQAPKKFLLEMSPYDRVVVAFDNSLHMGIVEKGFKPDPNPSIRKNDEHFKCRPIRDEPPDSPKEFPLGELPAGYRLVSATGQQTIQRIRAYEPLVQLLDSHETAQEIKSELEQRSIEDLLPMFSPKQWEVLCAEYLRSEKGVRPLLAVGGTLKDIDIYGVDDDGRRILAQCKNDSKPWKAEDIRQWVRDLARDPDDILYFFSRGGVDGDIDEAECRTVTGEEILEWLEPLKDYQRHLKIL